MAYKGEFSKLLDSGKIGSLELKNRIIMPPMASGFPTIWGEATDVMIEFFKARARGGAALLFVEVTAVATAIDQLKQLPRMLRLDDDGFAPGLAEVVESVHEAGAKIGIQLSPGFASQARLGPWVVGKQHVQEVVPVGPSSVLHPETRRKARELSVDEIQKLIELFGFAALRAKEVGFDIIEIHAHSGFLIGQFLSPYFNRRTDKYGGSAEDRSMFLMEIIQSTRSKVGHDFPLVVKFSVDEFIEGGRGLKEGQGIARNLEKAGINGITVSSGIHGSKLPSIPSMYHPDGAFIPLAEALKDVVSIPVILPGKLGDPYLAEKALGDHKADFVALGRALIADPDLPRKLAEGRTEDIRRCIYCNECLRVQWAHRFPLRCTVNPIAGREHRYGVVRLSEKKKKVVVIGAGPAGMEAARVAALRGHDVVLYEMTDELGGGQLRLASIPPYKEVLKHIPRFYVAFFKKLKNLKVVLGHQVSADEVTKDNADIVVLATGAEATIPDISGVNKRELITAHQLLSGQRPIGKTVVVVGGGSVGCEAADFLAKQGKKVTVVEMLQAIASDVHSMVRIGLLDELNHYGVKVLTGVKIDKVTKNGLEGVVESRRIKLKADTVVFALGVKPRDELAKNLIGNVREIHIIGDAREPRRIRNAISEGYITAYDI